RDAGFLVNAVQPDAIRLAPPLILSDREAGAFLAAFPGILARAAAAAQAPAAGCAPAAEQAPAAGHAPATGPVPGPRGTRRPRPRARSRSPGSWPRGRAAPRRHAP